MESGIKNKLSSGSLKDMETNSSETAPYSHDSDSENTELWRNFDELESLCEVDVCDDRKDLFMDSDSAIADSKKGERIESWSVSE
jgi:hypothetical protein